MTDSLLNNGLTFNLWFLFSTIVATYFITKWTKLIRVFVRTNEKDYAEKDYFFIYRSNFWESIITAIGISIITFFSLGLIAVFLGKMGFKNHFFSTLILFLYPGTYFVPTTIIFITIILHLYFFVQKLNILLNKEIAKFKDEKGIEAANSYLMCRKSIANQIHDNIKNVVVKSFGTIIILSIVIGILTFVQLTQYFKNAEFILSLTNSSYGIITWGSALLGTILSIVFVFMILIILWYFILHLIGKIIYIYKSPTLESFLTN